MKQIKTIRVSLYTENGNLCIIAQDSDCGKTELTVNPVNVVNNSTLTRNQAYVPEEYLELVERYRLGQLSTDSGISDLKQYRKVDFDLERLAEFDSRGVKQYQRHWEINEFFDNLGPTRDEVIRLGVKVKEVEDEEQIAQLYLYKDIEYGLLWDKKTGKNLRFDKMKTIRKERGN